MKGNFMVKVCTDVWKEITQWLWKVHIIVNCLINEHYLVRKGAMDDRLSSMPDDVIHKILSFISIKDAIRTSVLSTRWRSTWTSMPYLNFENQPHLSELIANVLSRLNDQIQVSSINLVLERTVKDDESVTRIMDYTFSHNVQQLSVKRSGGNILECPFSFIATPKWDLPFLTTLHLHCVKLSDDNGLTLFSKCTNLKNLFLIRCSTKGSKVLDICHPRLSNLTLEHTEVDEVVNVVAPQLKSLTIIWCRGKHLINAPGLTSLVIQGFHPWQLSTSAGGFRSLDKVDLLMYDPEDADVHKIVSLFQHFHSVKLLKLDFGIFKRLFSQRKSASSSLEQIPHKAFAFPNAKILKFSTKPWPNVYLELGAQEKVTRCSTEITSSAIFPMVSCEEITAMRNMALAQVFVKQLGQLVKECKANTNRDTEAYMGKPQFEMHWAWELGWNLGVMMAVIRHLEFVEIETCLMIARIKEKYAQETRPIMAWLKEMRALFERTGRLITEQLSESKRAVMLPFFLSLCEDAAILTIDMLGWMNTRGKKNALIM